MGWALNIQYTDNFLKEAKQLSKKFKLLKQDLQDLIQDIIINKDFGVDTPEHYGTLIYYDQDGFYHEEKVVSVIGDYARVYDGIYDSIVNGKEQVIQPWQTILQMEMLETGVKDLK